MKKQKKSLLLPTVYILSLFVITSGVYFTKKTDNNYEKVELGDIKYVSNGIFDRSIPIINVSDKIKIPFSDENVKIARYYYDSNSSIDMKEKSLVFYENTYMPNTGVDYISEKVFDILAIYDGTVIDVLEDELLGKTVKIKHNSELISVYQGIDNLEVKKGDIIFTGQKIATSGKNKINKDLGNHMHFEIYKGGITINPINCFDKKIGDI